MVSPGSQQAIGFQRFEDVAHGRRAAFNCVEVELAGGLRISAHCPHQVLVGDALVVDQHAIGYRVIVADDRVHEFVDEGVRIESERLHRKRHHLREKGRAGHVSVLSEPRLKTAGDTLRLAAFRRDRRDVPSPACSR